MSFLSSLGRKGLFLFDPETAHGLSIAALKAGLVPACPAKPGRNSLRFTRFATGRMRSA